MTVAEPLIAAHVRALRRIARGDLHVATHRGVTPTPVQVIGGGAHVRPSVVTAPAFSVLRSRGLVEWTAADDGSGPWPLRLTPDGRVALREATR